MYFLRTKTIVHFTKTKLAELSEDLFFLWYISPFFDLLLLRPWKWNLEKLSPYSGALKTSGYSKLDNPQSLHKKDQKKQTLW